MLKTCEEETLGSIKAGELTAPKDMSMQEITCACTKEDGIARLATNLEVAAGLTAMRSIGYTAGWANKKTVEAFCAEEKPSYVEEKPRCTGHLVHDEYTYCPAHD